MSFFDRFRSADKVRENGLAKFEAQERVKREAFKAREQERRRIANSEWTYSDTTDQMRGTTMRIAQILSSNAVDFDFPYQGGSQALIAVRKDGHRTEVLLSVTNGQFDITVNGFSFNAKADNGPIEEWRGTEPNGGSTNLMFLTNPTGFLRQITKAERLIVEPSFYQHGRAQFVFNIGGLDKRFY